MSETDDRAALVERLRTRIAEIDKTLSDCRADFGDAYGKPNFIEDDGTERWEPCKHCEERGKDRTLHIEAIAALSAPPAPSEAARVLEDLQGEWHKWRQSLPIGAFSHADGLRFVRVIDAKLAALRAEAEGGDRG